MGLAPGDIPSEPISSPALETTSSRGTSSGVKARGGVHQKTGRVRFGTISGASVAGAPPAVVPASTTVPGAPKAEPQSGTAGTQGPSGGASADVCPAGSTLGVHKVGKGISLLTSDEHMPAAVGSSEATAASTGQNGPSGSFAGGGGIGREPSNGASRVSGSPANGHNVNGHSVSGRSVNVRGVNGRGVNGRSGNGGEEEVSHARFGEFTTPEPVSASRIASQVVRSVLESAGAGAGSRQPITRYGEIRSGPIRGGAGVRAGASDRASRNVRELGAGANTNLEERARAVVEVPPDAEERGGAAVGSSGGAGIRVGGQGIGDGSGEEMDTDEEELGSRTHTGMSELVRGRSVMTPDFDFFDVLLYPLLALCGPPRVPFFPPAFSRSILLLDMEVQPVSQTG